MNQIKENIVINNLGPIVHADIDINWLNIYIGPHASGKTITSQIIKFYITIFLNTFQSLYNEFSINKNLEIEFKFGLKNYLIVEFKKHMRINFNSNIKFDVTYNLGDNKMSFVANNNEITVEGSIYEILSKFIIQCVKELNKNKKKNEDDVDDSFKRFEGIDIVRKYLFRFRKEINIIIPYNVLYIPAGRTITSYLTGIIDNKTASVPSDLIEFNNAYEAAKKSLINDISGLTKLEIKKFKSFINKALKGMPVIENGEVKFKLDSDGSSIGYELLSSGQQEVLPIYTCLFNLLNSYQEYFIIIEEPEAHLHPHGQKDIVEFISMILNMRENFKFVITTHSPFILDAFNNHIFAYDAHKKNKEVSRIMGKDKHIKFESVSAYMFEKTSKSILDKSNRLIKKGNINDVSKKIFQTFNKILEKKYSDN